MSVLVLCGGRACRPVCPGARRLRPRRGALLPCRSDGSCWSAGYWQGAEPLPAGEEGAGPWPVGADRQGPLPGVAGEPGWQVPDPVAERTGVRVAQPGVVAVAEEAG